MRSSRRMARMARNKRAIPKLDLTSMMDVFTILVFFLLVNSATTEVLQQPKQITLPDSVVEAKPRETVVIFVGKEEVLVQGVRSRASPTSRRRRTSGSSRSACGSPN